MINTFCCYWINMYLFLMLEKIIHTWRVAPSSGLSLGACAVIWDVFLSATSLLSQAFQASIFNYRYTSALAYINKLLSNWSRLVVTAFSENCSEKPPTTIQPKNTHTNNNIHVKTQTHTHTHCHADIARYASPIEIKVNPSVERKKARWRESKRVSILNKLCCLSAKWIKLSTN